MFGILGLLGFIVILAFIIIFVVLSFLGNIIRSLFGLGRRAPKQAYGENTASSDNSHHTSTQNTTSSAHGKKKIFADDEGEYVEFEEVK